MKLQILSHAGMLVQNKATSLVCDPWIFGSCYWRSWWNFPPVPRELVNSLDPEYIYLTHIHWDHFQADSLYKLGKHKKVIVPKGNYARMKKDLNDMGFNDVYEMKHGETLTLGEGLKITSYQFGVFMDSAVLIEADGVKILNLNDSKHMGATLREIVKKHAPIDFVLRSHSSANSRLCYEIIGEPDAVVDDLDAYIQNFADTVRATGTKYAIPFASNHCHLHKEVFHYNSLVQTPKLVEEYFERHDIKSPQVKVMVSGDSYDSETGTFDISDYDYFADRDGELLKYQEANQPKLDSQYKKEEMVSAAKPIVARFFKNFSKSIPWIVRRLFKNSPFTWVLKSGEREKILHVNIYDGSVDELTTYNDTDNPIQIHTSSLLLMQCISLGLFSHLSISKRVKYRVSKGKKKYLEGLNLLFNFYEYDMLPFSRIFQKRFFETWFLRWREIVLYLALVKDLVIYRKLSFAKYLKPYVHK